MALSASVWRFDIASEESSSGGMKSAPAPSTAGFVAAGFASADSLSFLSLSWPMMAATSAGTGSTASPESFAF